MVNVKMSVVVSVVTPTYNRREWFPLAIHCYKTQEFPQKDMEWIIIDDSDEGKDVQDLVNSAGIQNLRYVRITDRKLKIGEKRNMLNKMVRGEFVVNWDDDDYYPPERISYSVRMLKGVSADIVGSSQMYIYFLKDDVIRTVGPYGKHHATASTWCFRKKLLDNGHCFQDDADKAEEKYFLKGYAVPLVQLDATKVVLVMSHNVNTVDKNKMPETPERFLMKDVRMKLKEFPGVKRDKWLLEFLKEKEEVVRQALKKNETEE